MNRKYQSVLFLMTMMLVFLSCRKDEIKYEEDLVIIQTTEDGDVRLQGHITDVNKLSIASAEVTAGDQTVYTDEYGFFIIDNTSVVNGSVSLSIKKEDFIPQYKKVLVVEGMVDAFVRASLLSNQGINKTFSSEQTTTITGNGGHTVTFLANSIVYENGDEYNGEVVFSSYYIDPTRSDLADIMPGDLSAINAQGEEVQLVSFGMLYGDLTTSTGELLQIKEGSTATVELEIQTTQLDKAPNQIPLWSLDERTATWLEESVAIKQGNKYIAQVSHFSFWNCDEPFPVVEVTGYAYDQNGLPISNAKIFVTVPGMGDTRYCTTDRSGCFYGKFPKDEDMVIGIHSDCGEEETLPFGPFSESTIVGDLTFDISEYGYVIEGVLLNCDLEPVYPGIVEITDSDGDITLVPTNGDGSFLITFSNCDGSAITIRSIDPVTLFASEEIIYNVMDGINNLGDIHVCYELGDYLTLTLDGQFQLFTNVRADRVGSKLVIYALNSDYRVDLELNENSTSSPLKLLLIQPRKGGLSGYFSWMVNNQEFAFNATAAGYIGEEVSGSFFGESVNLNIECSYNLTVGYELTPISGLVWNDINQNGIRESDEPTLDVARINFESPSVNIVRNKRTDYYGEYSFYGSHLGVNTLTIELSDDYFLSEENVGSINVDSDFRQSDNKVEVIISAPGQEANNIDAGIHN